MKKEKKIICPVCYKEHKTKSALASHFRHMDKDHQNFKQKFNKMVIRLYNKGWQRWELKDSPHLFFRDSYVGKIISEYLKEHPEKNNKYVGSVMVQCAYCGKDKVICKAKLKNQKNHFCSRDCQHKHFGENNIPWNKGLTSETSDKLKKMTKKATESRKKSTKWHEGIIRARKKLGKINNPVWYKNICKANKLIGIKNRKFHISKEKLKELYCEKSLSCVKIGKMYNVGHDPISDRLKKYGIKIQPCKPEYIRNVFKGMSARPTKPEQRLIELIKKNNLPYVYNGSNGGLIIARKVPDFYSPVYKNLLIEVQGEPYHDPKKSWFDVPYNKTNAGMKAYYKRRNYHCLTIWSREFHKKGWEEKILNKISKFQAKHVKNNIINKNIGASLMQIQLCGSV